MKTGRVDDPAAQTAWAQYGAALDEVLAQGRRGDAVALFRRYVGTPAEQIEGMRQAPFWASFEAVAPTLRYDAELLGATGAMPSELLFGVTEPVLTMCGDSSMPFMCITARMIGHVVPNSKVVTLEGQAHAAQPAVLAPELISFFSAQGKAIRAA